MASSESVNCLTPRGGGEEAGEWSWGPRAEGRPAAVPAWRLLDAHLPVGGIALSLCASRLEDLLISQAEKRRFYVLDKAFRLQLLTGGEGVQKMPVICHIELCTFALPTNSICFSCCLSKPTLVGCSLALAVFCIFHLSRRLPYCRSRWTLSPRVPSHSLRSL